jgi:hypothetical protein
MALLAATQGTPERLWAIVKFVAAHGGALSRAELQQWLKPRYDGVADTGRDEKDRSLVNQTVQAAAGLGLIVSQRDRVELLITSVPTDIQGFADLVHTMLIAQPAQSADADILDAFACATVQTEVRGNRQWLSEWTAAQIADLLTRSLAPRATETTDQRFNTSRPATWLRWLEFVGLNETLSSRATLLSVANRLKRVLAVSDLPRGGPVGAADFLNWVAASLPYLDNGALFLAASKRMGHVPTANLSRILSAALRDLHEDEVIRLVVPRGDAQLSARMTPDPFAQVQGFNAVVLNEDSFDD